MNNCSELPKDRRQTGVTSAQMRDAPFGAVFVWCNSALHYPETLARHLGRNDLIIRPASWLTPDNVLTSRRRIVIDHAMNTSVGLRLWLWKTGIVELSTPFDQSTEPTST